MMRFPGDPISHQDRFHAEQEERERILRLMQQSKERYADLGDSPVARAIRAEIQELETAVRQGWQRFLGRRRETVRDPVVVITVSGGNAEVHSNESGSEVVILNYDGLNEYGSKEDAATAEQMLQEERYQELAHFLHEIG